MAWLCYLEEITLPWDIIIFQLSNWSRRRDIETTLGSFLPPSPLPLVSCKPVREILPKDS